MSVSRRRRFIPVFDHLEQRTVPAGDILANVSHGVLNLYGDAEANQISITSDTKHNVTVTSLDDTTINGLDTVTFKNIQGLTVFLREGDDVLDISDASFAKPVNIYMGADNDTLSMDNVKVGPNSIISLGAGDDTGNFSNITTGPSLLLSAGAGNDAVTIDHMRGSSRTVIDLGADNDTATITDSTFVDRFQLLAGDGDDQVGIGTTKIGARSQLDGGDGTDALGLSDNNFNKNLEIAFWQSQTNGLLPVAVGDATTVDVGGSVTIDVASNDVSFTGTIDPTTVVITSDPTAGSVVVNSDGTVTYTNDGSAATSDSFSYTIQDDTGAVTNAAVVSITVDQSTPPVVVTANDDTASVAKSGNVVIPVSTNDTTASGTLDLTSIVITSSPANGTVLVNNDGTVTYTNNGSATTTDSFSYTIENDVGDVSNAAVVTVTIDQGPTANNDSSIVAPSGSVLIPVSSNDTVPSGTLDLTSIVVTASPTNGSVVVNTDGSVSYTNTNPAATTDSFSYTIKNNLGVVSNAALVSLVIDQGPTVNNDTATVAASGNVVIPVSTNDIALSGTTLDVTSIVITSMPTNGTLLINGNGTITYTNTSPTTNDSFAYKISDSLGVLSSLAATVSITVT